jgi:Transcriptional regulators
MNRTAISASSDAAELLRLLREVPRRWRDAVDARLRPVGLSQARWRALMQIWRSRDPVTQAALADVLGVEAPTLVRLLDRLEKDGWVRRVTCAQDRRVRHLQLTPRARELCEQIDRLVNDLRDCFLAGVAGVELRQCVSVLQHIESAAISLRGVCNDAVPTLVCGSLRSGLRASGAHR